MKILFTFLAATLAWSASSSAAEVPLPIICNAFYTTFTPFKETAIELSLRKLGLPDDGAETWDFEGKSADGKYSVEIEYNWYKTPIKGYKAEGAGTMNIKYVDEGKTSLAERIYAFPNNEETPDMKGRVALSFGGPSDEANSTLVRVDCEKKK